MKNPLKVLPTDLEAKKPTNYVGKFTVIHKAGINKFPIFDLALKFYNDIEGEATVWDVTNGYELLKFKTA